MPGSCLAIMDLPEPGGPISMMLCPPAAAISIQRLIDSCPLTSEKAWCMNLGEHNVGLA